MIVVCPYRPFAPESPAHRKLGPFDWVGALRMAIASVQQTSGWKAYALTDVDTALPVPTIQVETKHRRLMLWIVEVCLRYLESPAFAEDTLMLSPDTLMVAQVPVCEADLGIVARFSQKFAVKGKTILNGAQWWRHGARPQLIAFYRDALRLAEALPENRLMWGGDTDPLIALLSPVLPGIHTRAGLSVKFHDTSRVMESLRTSEIERLDQGEPMSRPHTPLLDFKYERKLHMRRYYEATLGQAVPA